MSDIGAEIRRAGLSLPDMIDLWERLLDTSPIGAEDDFFDLGGDSLLALNLFQELERLTGRALPITAIYDAATPTKLLDLVAGGPPAAFSPLVLLKPGDSEPPCFIVHGIGGNVIELEKLGRLIDTAHPVYAIQARGVDGREDPFDTIDAMADFDLAAIRARQSRGPYFLAGFSFGGLVALEMARRLGEAGEAVALVGLIDSFPHARTFARWPRQAARLGIVAHVFRTRPTRDAIAFVLARLRGRNDEARDELILANFPIAAATPELRKVYDAGLRALESYRPRYYPGEIDFFRPAVSIFPIAPARVWGKLARRFQLHRVAGNHDDMIREEAASLAAALSRVLRGPAGD
jgi:thioesterase domain-containing protein/acyl carrier protein